jgi:dUTP pyrophosphatase
VKIKIKKLHPQAKAPQYGSVGAACFDLHAIVEEGDRGLVHPGAPATFRTGLSFEIPPNHAMFIFSRSGHGFNNDIRLANCVGIIDSDYRGEVKVKLTNDNGEYLSLEFKDGDRIAQAAIVPLATVSFIEVEELTETERGTGGFGSTGK